MSNNKIEKFVNNIFFTNEDLSANILIEVKNLLLESDLPFSYVNNLIEQMKEYSLEIKNYNQERQRSLFFMRLKEILISYLKIKITNHDLDKNIKTGSVIKLIGMNGVGKTSTLIKLAYRFKNHYNKKICCISYENTRIGEHEQVKALCKNHNIDYFNLTIEQNYDLKLNRLNKIIKSKIYDTVFLDVPGIDVADDKQILSIKKLDKDILSDNKLSFIIVDSLYSQKINNQVLSSFNKIKFDGFIITKLDTHSKCGAIFSILDMNKDIYYTTYGEKIESIKEFNFENAMKLVFNKIKFDQSFQQIDKSEIEKVIKNNLLSNNFNMNVLLVQLKSIYKFKNSFYKLKSMIKYENNYEKDMINFIKKQIAIINSMTKEERLHYEIIKINPDRIKRIATGSGVRPEDVVKIIEKADQISNSFKK